MDKLKWMFADLPNVAVLTTNNVVNRRTSIIYVTHDEDDGMWQFHDGSDVDEQNAMLISLEEAVEIDPSIIVLADLPLGWVAWRERKGELWKRAKEQE